MIRSMWKVLLPIIVTVALAAGLVAYIHNHSQTSGDPSTLVGSVTSDFKLHRLEGDPQTLADLKKKLILVNFWATWCDACVDELPSLIKLREKYKDQGFEVVAVSVDEDPKAAIPAMVSKLGIPFPMFFDHEQLLSTLFDISVIPFTVILDQNRKVLFREAGERDWFSQKTQNMIQGWLEN